MNESVKNVISFTAGVIVGGVTGFIVAQKMLKTTLDAELEEQIKDVKEHYKLLRKEEEYSTPMILAEKYDDVLEGLEYLAHEEKTDEEDDDDIQEIEEESEAIPVGNLFERNKNEPYVIPVAEFMNDSNSFDKITITYFEEDDVLCDEREEVIPNVEGTVGNDALTKFGYMSDDEKIVYVRNERLKTDFEVLKEEKSYAEVVLGFKEEKEVRKMREDD